MSLKPLLGFLMGICAAAGASASTCSPGYFDPLNGSNCQAAQPGSFVSIAGATAATLAPRGFFTDLSGATFATPAPLGRYVPEPGSAFATPAPLGTYVGVTGASAPTPAPLGTYVGVTGASAPTPAPLGTYVAVTGASAPTPAPLGTYVGVTGASAPTPAPLGTYVAVTGAFAPTPAPLGTFVAVTGASAPTPVARGFYTASTGATTGTGAGLMASPLNMAIDATHGLLSSQKDMKKVGEQSLDVAISGRHTRNDQAGLSGQKDLSMNSAAVVLQHAADSSPQTWKFFGGLADHKLKATSAGSGQARTWLLGASRGLVWGQEEPWRASFYAGHSSADIVRNLSELLTAETQTHKASLRIMGLSLSTGIPVPLLSANLLVETGLVHYTQSALSENGTAVGTIGGLQVDKYSQWAAPVFVSLQHPLGALNLQWGLRADLAPKRELNASLNSGGNYSFAIPVGLSSTQAFVVKVSLKELTLGQGVTLTGSADLEAGSKVRRQQLQMVLAKRW